MRPLPLLALVSLLALAGCASPAVRDARAHAERIAEDVGRYDLWIAEDVGYYLTREEQHLTVLDVSGDGYTEPGHVLIKVRGKEGRPVVGRAPKDPPFPPPETVVLCFDLEVVPRTKDDENMMRRPPRKVNVSEIDCPETSPPRSFRPPAQLSSGTRLRLKELLPPALDLNAVQRAVRELELDPRIRQELVQRDGKIGLALRALGGDCLLAKIRPPSVAVWSPHRPWMPPKLPHERYCTAAQALDGYTGTPE